MKKIYNIFLLAATLMLSLTGCSNQEPFITAGPDDTPRFLAPSSIEGNVQTSVSQTREEVFSMDIVVTPAKYTTIQWISDGHVLGTGTTFSRQFEAGTYELNIKATTQAGKEAYRIVKLSVNALADDPTFNNKEKNRWLNPGQPLTIIGSNLAEVKSLIFTPVIEEKEEEEIVRADEPANNQPVGDGSIEVNCEASEDGSNVTVTLPSDMMVGPYRVSAVNDKAERFGLGLVTVSNEEYVEGDVVEVELWEGNTDIDWGASNVTITAEELANVPVGTTLRLFYEPVDMPDGYHALRITTPWWGDKPEDQVVAQFDLTDETPNPFEFTYTEANKAIVDERGGMLIVGYGYKLTKVSYEMVVAPAETPIWEGSTAIDWGASNVTLSTEEMAVVPVGATIHMYYEMFDMPDGYHAMRITTPWWGDKPEDQVVAQFDLTDETPNPFDFTYTDANKAIVDERGGMLVVGYGYKLTKITFEK